MSNSNIQNLSFNSDTISDPDNSDNGQSLDKDLGSERQGELIHDMGSIITSAGDYTINCLTIIGQIEGHYSLSPQNKTTKYEHVIPQLMAVEQESKIDGLLVLLNTVGGDVEAGLAIAELIAGMNKPTVSLVLGGGHSIGVPLAVAAKRSFIARSASMTIHPVRMNGLIVGVPQTLEYFKRMQDRITKFVTDNSNISAKRFTELSMNTEELATDVGTILNGDEAVKEGLIDGLGSLSEALNALYDMIDKNKPKKKNKNKSKMKSAKNKKSSTNKR